MSDARELNMAKIAANVAELDQTSPNVPELDQTNQATDQTTKELSTQRQITRLEKALEIAKSKQVKEKLKEEIQLAKIRKEEEEKRKQETLETIQKTQQGIGIAANVASGITGTASNIAGKTVELTTSATDTLSTISAPGSIFLPISILLLFFFLILPVKGMTRAQWLFLAITGQAKIMSSLSHPQEKGGSGDITQQETQPSNGVFSGYRVSGNYSNMYIRRKE